MTFIIFMQNNMGCTPYIDLDVKTFAVMSNGQKALFNERIYRFTDLPIDPISKARGLK